MNDVINTTHLTSFSVVKTFDDPTVSLENFRKTAANFPPVEDIEGIGPWTASKLREAGYTSIKNLAVANIEDLSADINCTKAAAKAFIMAAKKLLNDSNV